MSAITVGFAAPAARAAARVRRVPYSSEIAVLAVIVVAMQTFRGGLATASIVAGFVGAAPLVLNAMGLVLVFRANRFLNFAQLQVGLFGAALFDGLYRGQAILHGVHRMCSGCVGAFPGSTARSVNFALSAVAGIAASVAISFVVYVLIVRRFAKSPVLVSSIVTVFLAQALAGFQGQLTGKLVKLTNIEKGLTLQTISPPLDRAYSIGGFPVHTWQLVLIVVAPLVLVGTTTYLTRTNAGASIRAAADNPQRASTLGVNVTLVSARVWMLVGLMSGLAAVLPAFAGSSSGTDSAPQSQVAGLVILFTAIVFARFTNLWMAAIAAVVLSVLTTSVQVSFSSEVGLNAAYVFIVGILLLLQRDTSTRASREDFSGLEVTRELRPIPRELRQLPQVRRYVRIGSIGGAAILLFLPFVLSISNIALLSDSLGLCLVGLSLLVLTGWAGQVSLGQFGFASIGAWAAAVSGLPFPLAVLLGGLAGAAAAVLVGLPALKLKGLNLAISTLAFAVSAQALFIDTKFLGSYLPATLPRPTFFGIDLSDERVTFYVTLAIVVFCCFVVVGLRRSRTGRALIALRANEATAQSFGISSLRARLVAFSISGFMAAVAGALLAYHLGGVESASFTPDKSLVVFLYSVLGGLGGIAGPLIGMTVYALINFFFSTNPLVQYLGAGTGAVLLMLVAPGGLAELVYKARDSMLRRLAVRLRIPVPSLMGDRGAVLASDRVVLEEKRDVEGDLPPLSYKPSRQWALDRLGSIDEGKERVGVR